MGLKEEMTADLDPKVLEKATAASATSKTKRVADSVHQHGNGRVEEAWIDEDGRRRTRPAQGPIPKYVFSCKACIAEDAKRMAAPSSLTEDDMENVVFLIPERNYDATVAQAYLAKRYPGMSLFATSTIRPARLALHKGAKIVVVNRRPVPGTSMVGPSSIQTEDRHGTAIEKPVPPSDYLNEVVESEPITVSDALAAAPGSMFADQSIDLTELCLRLCELAQPTCFIAQYRRTVGSDEQVFTMRTSG